MTDFTTLANRITAHLERGSIEQAHATLASGWREHLESIKPLPYGDALLVVSLAQVISDVRILNALEDAGLMSVGDLTQMTTGEIEGFRRFGPDTVSTVRRVQAAMRLRMILSEVA